MALGYFRPLMVGMLAIAAACAANAEDDTGGDPVAQAHPSLIAGLASKSIVMDIVKVGGNYLTVGEKGHILVSTDASKWTQMPSPNRSMINRLFVLNDQQIWAVGADYAIMHSEDGGKSWKIQHFNGIGRQLYDIYFFDRQHGIAVGSYGKYMETRDGGNTWNDRSFGFSDVGMHLNSIARLGDGSIAIAGERGIVIVSSDLGETWKVVNSPYIGSFFGILPYKTNGFLTFGLRGNIYVVEDITKVKELDQAKMVDEWDLREIVTDPAVLADLGWRQITNEVVETMYGGSWQTADSVAVMGGASGAIIEVDVSAGTTKRLESPTDEVLSKVVVLDGRRLAVGRRGVFDVKGSN